MRTLTTLAVVVAVAGACEKKTDEKPVDKRPVMEAPKTSDPLCVGRPTTAPEEKLDIGGKAYTRKGSTISLDAADADDEFVIGQITDIKDHNPDSAANIAAILAWMKAEKVDVIAITGDLGETPASIEKVLRDVAAVGVPVLAVIGNRECRDHFAAGVAAAQKDLKNVVNMNTTRVFNTDDGSVVSLPGYYNPAYLHCADGCEYTVDDVKALPEVASMATAPVKLLMSHGPPLQAGERAIDRIHEGANVGDPALAEVLKQNAGLFPFGMFGHIQEAGGYATDLSGAVRVAADTFAESFYLNPGPSDAVRWVMLDGSQSVGMAGVVHVKGKQASYKIYRMKPGEARPVPTTPTAAPGAATPGKDAAAPTPAKAEKPAH